MWWDQSRLVRFCSQTPDPFQHASKISKIQKRAVNETVVTPSIYDASLSQIS